MKSIEWLAGLLEGEGCFSSMPSGSSGLYTTPVVQVAMTDKDVIANAHEVFEHIGGRGINTRERQLPSGKTCYHLSVTGLPAVRIMCSVLPYMGNRREEAILGVIAEWNPVKYKEAVAFKQQIQGVA